MPKPKNSNSYSGVEFKLEVIRRVSCGEFGVKVKPDGKVLLDVHGYMQPDGSIGPDPNPKFNLELHPEFKVDS
jgi:hypothetical protein